jgi:hypothetical protein
MITIECTWCDADLTIDSLDAASVDCPDCRITVEFAPDPGQPIAIAA